MTQKRDLLVGVRTFCIVSAVSSALVVGLAGCGPKEKDENHTDSPTGGVSESATPDPVPTAWPTDTSVVLVTPSPNASGEPQPVITVSLAPSPEPIPSATAEPEAVPVAEIEEDVDRLAEGEGLVLPASPLTYAYGWSPTRNEYLYFSKSTVSYELVLVNLASGDSKVLTNDRAVGYGYSSFAWSPNGNYVALVNRSTGYKKGEDLVIYSRAGGAPVLTVHRTRVLSVEWSHDSSRLLYSASDVETTAYEPTVGSSMYELDFATGASTLIGTGAYPSWSPDETRIAYFGDDGADHTYGGWVLDVATGDKTNLSPEFGSVYMLGSALDSNTALMPAWSPDGSMIAFNAPSEDTTSFLPAAYNRDPVNLLVDSDGSNLRPMPFNAGDHRASWSPDGRYVRSGVAVFDAETLALTAVTSVTNAQDYPGGLYIPRSEARSVVLFHWRGGIAGAATLPRGWHQEILLGWSYDGKYLAIYGTGPDSEAESQGIIRLAAPTP